MKKLNKQDELNFLKSVDKEGIEAYIKESGICPAVMIQLFEEQKELFEEFVPLCKRIPQEVISKMLEEEKYLPIIMTKCLSTENQLKFVELYPHRVKEYLETLEENLSDGRGAYLSPEAEDFYWRLCEEDSSLPKIKKVFNLKAPTNSPFAGLKDLL